MDKIRVIHADDHKIVRDAIKVMLESNSSHIEIVGQVGSWSDLEELLIHTDCDLLLLDGVIVGGKLPDHLPVIRAQYPKIKVLLLWMFAGVESLVGWIHLLDGHLPLGSSKEELVHAIDQIMKGEKHFSLPIPRSK